jgi:gluconolactonase
MTDHGASLGGAATRATPGDQSDAVPEGLIGQDTTVSRIASGFSFTEGPIWMPDQSLHFSDIPGDTRYRWHPGDGLSVVRRPSGKSNGMTLQGDGSLLICEHLASCVTRESRDGTTRTVIAAQHDGKELNSPNDVIAANDGSVFFTDPTFGRISSDFGRVRPCEQQVQGVYLAREGAEAELLLDDFDQPNGLCLSPDESLLYVNDTGRAHIRVFAMRDGRPQRGGQVFADRISATPRCDDGFVDGMKVDEHGNVYVTGPGGIWVFSPAGAWLGVIAVPEKVANLNWGGPGWRTLYITASTSVYCLPMNVSGTPLAYMH